MIFALLTLLASFALAAVAGWFSISGLMAILAGQPIAALILGITLEAGKLVTTSWLYRNWDHASWKIKAPLIYFMIALMLATSMGVFGFLSKAHLEQGAPTLDNKSKIERIDQQIIREKSLIADNDKVIQQLDATVNSFLGKDRTDKALAVRKSQVAQRKQLKDDSDAIQKRIEILNDEKFKLESDLRKLQLEVGPIRYIAELIYGEGRGDSKSLESAVRIFTLIIVSTLDPLAITLLIAANYTILRLQNEKEKDKNKKKDDGEEIFSENISSKEKYTEENNSKAGTDEKKESKAAIVVQDIHESGPSSVTEKYAEMDLSVSQKSVENFPIKEIIEDNVVEDYKDPIQSPLPRIQQPAPSRVLLSPHFIPENVFEDRPAATVDNSRSEVQEPVIEEKDTKPWAAQATILRELIGNLPHPKNEKAETISSNIENKIAKSTGIITEIAETTAHKTVSDTQVLPLEPKELDNVSDTLKKMHKYPERLSWVNEFKRS